MPNHLRLAFLLVFAICGFGVLSAQENTIDMPDPALDPRPNLIILSGITAQGGGGDGFQLFFLSVERPFGAYRHIGVQYLGYLPQGFNSYYQNIAEGGGELSLFSKFFLHGRLSGRRSHLYYGPQLRFGGRNMLYTNSYPTITSVNYRVGVTKVLFCLGGQYQLGHASFEWSLPLGVEYERSNFPGYLDPYGYNSSGNTRHFVVLPSIALGLRL